MNKIIISGNLGKDPKIFTSDKGTTICKFSLAARDSFGESTWFNVVVFGKQGDSAAKFLSKGDYAIIEGRLQIRKFTDKEGNEREGVDVAADRVEFGPKSREPRLDSKPVNESPQSAPDNDDSDVPW